MKRRRLSVAVTAIAVLTGLGTDWIAAAGGSVVAASLIAVATLDCLWVGTYNLSYPLRNPVQAVTAGDFRQVREPGTGYFAVSRDMLRVTLMNEGIINCNDYAGWSTPVAAAGEPTAGKPALAADAASNGTSARDRIAPEPGSTSSSLTR